jgi:23S rRNA A2030 N6-methylase RlmJ
MTDLAGNPRFANVGDVVKHLVLAEVLAWRQPLLYREAHSGAADYPLSAQSARPLDARARSSGRPTP